MMKEKQIKRANLIVAIIVLLFAITGIVFIVINVVGFAQKNSKKNEQIEVLNEFLSPICAIDITPFDDISAADGQELVDVTLWAILSKDTTPDTYPYRDGFMIIPQDDVEQEFIALFGNDAKSVYKNQTIEGYNYTFVYDENAKQYKIPVTSITPIYSPNVTSYVKKGDSVIVTVEYIAYDAWDKKNGKATQPTADKVMKITLRKIKDSYTVGAVQLVSKTRPEAITS